MTSTATVTHVAGLIGSSGASSNGKFAGVAPGVKLLALRVLDRKGAGKTSAVIAALEFAVANKDRFGIRIVNLSLGHPIYESAATDPLVQAVEATVRAGLVVVTAAGNYGTNQVTGETGYAGIVSPGNAPSAITVGASNTFGTDRRVDDRVANFSSRGPSWYDGIAKPDVVAPGTGLVSNAAFDSTLVTGHPSLLVTSGYTTFLRLDGSSMATAVVSGLTAVMLEANNVAASQRWQEYQSTLPKGRRTDYTGTTPLTANAVKAMLQVLGHQAAQRERRTVRRADPGQRRGQRRRCDDARLPCRHDQGDGDLLADGRRSRVDHVRGSRGALVSVGDLGHAARHGHAASSSSISSPGATTSSGAPARWTTSSGAR